MEDARKLSLITDRTIKTNLLRLERWVTASNNKVDQFTNEKHSNSVKKKAPQKTED